MTRASDLESLLEQADRAQRRMETQYLKASQQREKERADKAAQHVKKQQEVDRIAKALSNSRVPSRKGYYTPQEISELRTGTRTLSKSRTKGPVKGPVKKTWKRAAPTTSPGGNMIVLNQNKRDLRTIEQIQLDLKRKRQ